VNDFSSGRFVSSWNISVCRNVEILQNLTVVVGGVTASVLAIQLQARGFILAENDRFLRAIKICSTPSFGRQVKPDAHVVKFYCM
jgi:hypothetical protein